MTHGTSSIATAKEWDPVFLHSKREAIVIISTWVVALLWTVPYCYFNGYQSAESPREVSFILGMPDWVFWGVATPWMVANLFTVWFCFGYMVDDDLEVGSAHADSPQTDKDSD